MHIWSSPSSDKALQAMRLRSIGRPVKYTALDGLCWRVGTEHRREHKKHHKRSKEHKREKKEKRSRKEHRSPSPGVGIQNGGRTSPAADVLDDLELPDINP